MLEKSLQVIDEEMLVLEGRVSELMDDYWEWFTVQCKLVWDAKKRGETVKPGRIAPVIERKKSGEHTKIYIRWKSFGGEFVRRAASSRAKSAGIAPAATADHTKAIKSAGDWEVKNAVELELKLVPLRLAIEGLHAAKVRLAAAQRKINRNKKDV